MRRPAMEIRLPRRRDGFVLCSVLLLLGIVSFSCCIAAEFEKVQAKNMKVDGSLCSLPPSRAFGLGIAALVCLSVAQIFGTTRGGSRICSTTTTTTPKAASGGRVFSFLLLLCSWIIYVTAAILLATASSMNRGQPYGRGWTDGDCYVVHDGIYGGAAALVAAVVALVLVFNLTTDGDGTPLLLPSSSNSIGELGMIAKEGVVNTPHYEGR